MAIAAAISLPLTSPFRRSLITRLRHSFSPALKLDFRKSPWLSISACRHLITTKAEGDGIIGTSSLPSKIIPLPSESRCTFDTRQLFDEMSQTSVVSATAIIGRCAKQHRHEEAVYLFSRMLVLNVRPNEFTFGTVIHSATALGDVNIGKQLHACAIKTDFHGNVFVGSALLDLYAKLNVIEEAHRAFEDIMMPNVVSYTSLISGYLKMERIQDALRIFIEMPERNVVSWNAMIGGFSQKGHNEEAVHLFIDMLREGFFPTPSTFPCAIRAVANMASLGMGRSFHACAVKFLVLCGYAQNGRGKEAIAFFERMSFAGCRPNSVTLLSLLWACNHAGLVDEGYSYFNQVRFDNPSLLKSEHYACMVDLLSRSGRFRQAEEFIEDLPFDPGIGFWKSLLGGCQIHSNMELGKWQSVSTLRREMKEKGMKRVPGCSWIEIRSKVHIFVTGDRNHHQKDEIYSALRLCIEQLREESAGR